MSAVTRWTVTAALLASAIALTACGGSDRKTSSPSTTSSTAESLAPQSFTVVGTLTLTGPYSASQGGSVGETCYGIGGFSDLKLGTQVTVTDATGSTVALGSITNSDVGGDPGTPARTCAFDFSVADVPRGESFYKVMVAQRDGPQYTEEDLGRGLRLTLGDA